MRSQILDWPDGGITHVHTQYKAEVEQTLLIVIRHVQHNQSLALALERKAKEEDKKDNGNKSNDLQGNAVILKEINAVFRILFFSNVYGGNPHA